jgi:hypothetical protein
MNPHLPARVAAWMLELAAITIVAVAVALALGGCSGQIAGAQSQVNKITDALITDLAKIGATAGADLQTAEKVAQAATPPDTDGLNCAAAALTVQGQIAVVLTAANQPAAGALTTAEVASLFQPGSAQYNAAKQVLTSGCAAKAQDVLGAAGVLAAGGALGAIAGGQVLPLLAAAP